ncbi:hypothetical protein BWO91_17665 [Plantibacter flavus]|uniref:hypothetical protein n=1 Tax=Plantibacter flavus TaxID=150123 RepID=UPI00099C9AA7|nr:hypothetical protein [Plantibacter flavus]AQX81548.1 hypothetical protein BWO91_17665 [Plantibacter flavus]
MASWAFSISPCNADEWTAEPQNAARIVRRAQVAALYTRAGDAPMRLESVVIDERRHGKVTFTTE